MSLVALIIGKNHRGVILLTKPCLSYPIRVGFGVVFPMKLNVWSYFFSWLHIHLLRYELPPSRIPSLSFSYISLIPPRVLSFSPLHQSVSYLLGNHYQGCFSMALTIITTSHLQRANKETYCPCFSLGNLPTKKNASFLATESNLHCNPQLNLALMYMFGFDVCTSAKLYPFSILGFFTWTRTDPGFEWVETAQRLKSWVK